LLANNLTDLSPLSELQMLKKLVFLGMKTDDLNDFRVLSGLRELSIGILFVEDSPTESWIAWKNTWMSQNLIDMSPLADLTNLKKLAIGFAAIESFESLQSINKLEELYLRKTRIKELPSFTTET
jgi:Leucine-rich repeat (LRR) protein